MLAAQALGNDRQTKAKLLRELLTESNAFGFLLGSGGSHQGTTVRPNLAVLATFLSSIKLEYQWTQSLCSDAAIVLQNCFYVCMLAVHEASWTYQSPVLHSPFPGVSLGMGAQLYLSIQQSLLAGALDRWMGNEKERQQLLEAVAYDCQRAAQLDWASELFLYADSPRPALNLLNLQISDLLEPGLQSSSETITFHSHFFPCSCFPFTWSSLPSRAGMCAPQDRCQIGICHHGGWALCNTRGCISSLRQKPQSG